MHVDPDERVPFQQLASHPAVEGVDIAVLHRLVRRDVMPLDAVILRQSEDGVRGEFGAVIGNDIVRLAATAYRIGQFTCYPTIRVRCAQYLSQALMRHVIDEVQHSKAPSAGELVVQESPVGSAHSVLPRPGAALATHIEKSNRAAM